MEPVPYTLSYEAMLSHSVDMPHSTQARYLAQNDVPDYAIMFYQPTEQDTFTAIKYGNFVNDYDSNLKEIHEAMQGPPLEMYIPAPQTLPDGIGRNDTRIIDPEIVEDKLADRINREISEEINKHSGAKVIKIEMEEQLIRKRRKTLILKRK